MNMPARQFFTMIKASGKLRALERLEECDIAMIPACQPAFYKEVKNSYLSKVIDQSLHMEPTPTVPRGAIDSASEDAKHALSSLMANLKRSTH